MAERHMQASASANTSRRLDTKVLLSTLWIVVMINMLKADVLSLYIPGTADMVARTAGSNPIAVLMLGGAVMMEISIAMIILSRVLAHGVNRWANILVGILTIAFVVLGRADYPHYTFIAAVEIICLLLIIWFAWKWRASEA